MIGHSAGSAGALLAAIQRPSLKAAVGLAAGSPVGNLNLATDTPWSHPRTSAPSTSSRSPEPATSTTPAPSPSTNRNAPTCRELQWRSSIRQAEGVRGNETTSRASSWCHSATAVSCG
ncbi:MAG TPA: hypothetical protein VJ914_32420 [Pseudonocardiaceae bacterium]|nr:hypothetical protein [Pseudonocardiaceae bacterium]